MGCGLMDDINRTDAFSRRTLTRPSTVQNSVRAFVDTLHTLPRPSTLQTSVRTFVDTAAELLSPRRRDNSSYSTSSQVLQSLADIPNPTRLDSMFLYHTRLWKKPRLSLKEIYASVLSLSREHKLAVGKYPCSLLNYFARVLYTAGHFANVYHRVIDTYLLVDREAETSIKYFALQLFTVPSVAAHIVRNHKLVSRLLAIITVFFTNQIAEKHIVYPPVSNAVVDVDSFPFKSKWFMPVFSDLRYPCHNEPVQQLIVHSREFIVQFAKTCQLFMCVNQNKRAATNHVEYETDAWISVFNVLCPPPRTLQMSARGVRRPATPPTCPSALQTSAKGVRQLHAPHHTPPLSQRAESKGMEMFGAGEPKEHDTRWRRVDVSQHARRRQRRWRIAWGVNS
jgi:hypothetical protein